MDLSKIKDLKDLQALLELMGRYDLAEIELEGEGQKIRLRKAEAAAGLVGFPAVAQPGLSQVAMHGSAPGASSAPPPAPALPANVREVASPMVGTFYRASSPEADPFVKEGDIVEPDTILCIIEAMKVMNEIPAGIGGVIREILVKNGESVEYGKPLFRIEVE